MNTQYLEKWTTALRSGEYKQTQCTLRRDVLEPDAEGDMVKTSRFCCLGVLCDLVKDEVGAQWETAPLTGGVWLNGKGGSDGDINSGFLIQSIVDLVELPLASQRKLTTMNDSDGATFEEIANYLEENAELL